MEKSMGKQFLNEKGTLNTFFRMSGEECQQFSIKARRGKSDLSSCLTFSVGEGEGCAVGGIVFLFFGRRSMDGSSVA
jgi:hypothetical protein